MYEQSRSPGSGTGRKDDPWGGSSPYSHPSGGFIFSFGKTLGSESSALPAPRLAMDSDLLRYSDFDSICKQSLR